MIWENAQEAWGFLGILNFFNILSQHHEPKTAPIIHPNPLWIISSNSNNPRQVINCNNSITNDVPIPITKPLFQLILLSKATGNKQPYGINNMQFRIFSFSISLSWYTKNAFQDQNMWSSYWGYACGMRVKTVDSNTVQIYIYILRYMPDFVKN